MLARTILGVLVILLAATQTGYAGGGDISKYFSKTATEVKATDNPVEKRNILQGSLETMTGALDRIERSGYVTSEDRISAMRLKATLQEKQDELNGTNAYERVTDSQLNSFADYVVQDMQQADQYITISLVAVLLILIVLILIL